MSPRVVLQGRLVDELRPVSVGGGCTTVFLRQRSEVASFNLPNRPNSTGTVVPPSSQGASKVNFSHHLVPVLSDRPTSWATPDGCWHHGSSPVPYARDVYERRKRLPHVLVHRLGDLEDNLQRQMPNQCQPRERRFSTSSHSASMPSLRQREATAALEGRLRAIEDIFGATQQEEVTSPPLRHFSLERLEILATPKQRLPEAQASCALPRKAKQEHHKDASTSKELPTQEKSKVQAKEKELPTQEKTKVQAKEKAAIQEGSKSTEVISPPLLPRVVGLGMSLEKDTLSPSSVAASSMRSGAKSVRQASFAGSQGYSGSFDDDESEAPSVSTRRSRDLRVAIAAGTEGSEGYDDFDADSPAKSFAKTKSNVSAYSFESDSQVL